MNLAATTTEQAYISEVLGRFKVAMPEATIEQRKSLAAKTLFRMRCWDVIWRFRQTNYSTSDPLNAEFIE